MKFTRDLDSEKYENTKSVFLERIPSGYYEVILRGELNYPVTEYDSSWITSSFFKKDKETDNFIKGLLALMDKRATSIDEVLTRYEEITKRINTFIDKYCDKYEKLPNEFQLEVITEDQFNMTKETGSYSPITRPFELFVTYNDNNKIYKVTL